MIPRGWALVLSAYLLVWIPAGFAAELLSTIPSLGRRGLIAVGELAVHAVVTAFCAVAGWMMLGRSPAAPLASGAAVALGAAVAIQSLFWTVLPRQTAPGQQLPLAALAAVHASFWILLLRHYRRARGV